MERPTNDGLEKGLGAKSSDTTRNILLNHLMLCTLLLGQDEGACRLADLGFEEDTGSGRVLHASRTMQSTAHGVGIHARAAWSDAHLAKAAGGFAVRK